MALTATYLEPSGKSALLCDELKPACYAGISGRDHRSLCEIFKRVENYYRARGDEKTIDLLRKCFYLKVSPAITANDLLRVNRQDKTSMMVEIVRTWHWPISYIRDINGSTNGAWKSTGPSATNSTTISRRRQYF
jgi:adenylate cyclase class 1